MGMRSTRIRARLAAGAFFLLLVVTLAAAPSNAFAATKVQIAADRTDLGCPAGSPVFGIVRFSGPPGPAPGADLSHCLLWVSVRDTSDASLDSLTSRLAGLSKSGPVLLDLSGAVGEPSRIPFAIKKLSSAVRSVSPEAPVGLALADRPAGEEDLSPYVDALVPRPPAVATGVESSIVGRWVFAGRATTPASAVIGALAAISSESRPSVSLVVLDDPGAAPPSSESFAALERLQAYFRADVSPDPTPTGATDAAGSSPAPREVLRYFDGKAFTPMLFLPESAAVRVDLSGANLASATAVNLETGARREFDLKGAKSLVLDPSKGALAVVLHPASRPDTRAAVEVGAARGLTAEEIVARERAWETGQREHVQSWIADMKTSLRFRIAEVNETFDLTIRGPFFFRLGEPPDWEWDEFYLNGVKWKGKTLPKLPILQPEKVTTLPLDIRLSEDYAYELHGEGTVSGRRAYHITYTPKTTVGDRPTYRGAVWIDKATFSLLRRDSIQLNLKGETLSNIQTEIYKPVPGQTDILLPLEITGQQVFSTAGRTTAIERDVSLHDVVLNPPDFPERRAKAWASEAQMIRDTDQGMRYLIPDPATPGERIVQTKFTKKSTFAIAGAFYDKSLDYPIPLLGVQHFNFDLFGKGKQLSIFFGGAVLTTNYTDPAFLGTHFDLGADLFGAAIPFGDVAYRNGHEVPAEKVKHLPSSFQVNLGHPFGPYLKASVGLFTKYDNYQRDKDTGPAFVTPVDTFTTGAELKLVANISGFNATVAGSYFNRSRWEPWGDPADSEYDPKHKDYVRWEASLSKDQYFSGFRKLHVSLGYVDGSDLDRFSKYEFGSFSSHPMNGFQSGSLRTGKGWLANLSYGLNIEDIIRFEGFYDSAILTDARSGFNNTYYSGAGLLASLNGPWRNSLFRAQVGVPVVRHGVTGFVVNVLMLKLF
jgi:hypothetical protein